MTLSSSISPQLQPTKSSLNTGTVAAGKAPRSAVTARAAEIRLAAVSKSYGATTALDRVDLTIPAGSLTVIVGPSGCGKSSLLRILSGLEGASTGEVYFDDAAVTNQRAGDRDVAMVFQDYALYPHMTVAANIGFRLRLERRHNRRSGPSFAEIGARVREVGALLGLEQLLKRKPAQLSGGQRQRVALARAIVHRPQILLLDEPLSALDAQLRASARAEILRLHREIGSTLVLVTHDQHEALSMATHLVVMDHGRVAQSGTAEDVYGFPQTEFVAAFVGSPAMNFHTAGDRRIGWRPSDAELIHGSTESGGPTGSGGLLVSGTADVCEFTGDGQQVLCRSGGDTFTVIQRGGLPRIRPGDAVNAVVPASKIHRFDLNGRRLNDH